MLLTKNEILKSVGALNRKLLFRVLLFVVVDLFVFVVVSYVLFFFRRRKLR